MEELTIEQKAQRYDSNYKVYTELINRLENVKNAIKKQNYGTAMDILCKPYPEFQVITHSELKESEDEKIQVRNLNLSKILKKYPKETKLWSPLYGNLWLAEVDGHDLIICYRHKLDEGCNRCILEQESRDNLVYFWSDGSTGNQFYNSTSMCVLFPSYNNLDWETM